MPPKRRRAYKRPHLALSKEPIIKFPKHGRFVILKPTTVGRVITRFNLLALKNVLEYMAPDGVLQIGPNYQLKLLAVDTRNADATACLLKVKTVQGIPVQAYEPRSNDCGA